MKMDRRSFIRALGGLAGAVPFLPSLARGADPPRRFVVFFNPNGTMPDDYWPAAVRSETDFDLGTMLEPLAPLQSKMNLIRGIELAVAQIGPGEGHQKGMGGLLTGQKLLEGDFVGGDGSRAGWGGGVSIDQLISDKIAGNTPIASLELGVRATTSEVRSRIIYRAAGRPVPPENSPRAVFDRLFGKTSAGDQAARSLRMRSVLDGAAKQFGIAKKVLSSADQSRLDEHLTLVRDFERRLALLGSSETCGGVPARPDELATDDETTMPLIADLQVDLLAIALTCDLTRVGSIQMSNAQNGIRFPWLDSLGNGHSLSHAGPSNAGARHEFVVRGRWFSEKLLRLLQKLDAVDEGGRTALDNSLVFWGNELALGSSHSHVDMPFVMFGSAGGQLRTGRYLTHAEQQPHNNLLVSFLNLYGIPVRTFGHPDYCSGPLSSLA